MRMCTRVFQPNVVFFVYNCNKNNCYSYTTVLERRLPQHNSMNAVLLWERQDHTKRRPAITETCRSKSVFTGECMRQTQSRIRASTGSRSRPRHSGACLIIQRQVHHSQLRTLSNTLGHFLGVGVHTYHRTRFQGASVSDSAVRQGSNT